MCGTVDVTMLLLEAFTSFIPSTTKVILFLYDDSFSLFSYYLVQVSLPLMKTRVFRRINYLGLIIIQVRSQLWYYHSHSNWKISIFSLNDPF